MDKQPDWEMDWDHNRFVSILDTIVPLPSNNRELFREILETVSRYMFAFQYSEGEHGLQVRSVDWKLVNGLVSDVEKKWKALH